MFRYRNFRLEWPDVLFMASGRGFLDLGDS
jgi:hypothetical protein